MLYSSLMYIGGSVYEFISCDGGLRMRVWWTEEKCLALITAVSRYQIGVELIGWRPLTFNEMISLAVWLIACFSSARLLPHRDMRWAPDVSQYALGTWEKFPVSLGHEHEFIEIAILLCWNRQTPSLEGWHGSLSWKMSPQSLAVTHAVMADCALLHTVVEDVVSWYATHLRFFSGLRGETRGIAHAYVNRHN